MRFTVQSAIVLLAVAGATACHRAPVYPWHSLDAPDGTFSIELPGSPIKEDSPAQSAHGDLFVSHSFKTRASTTAAYACNWWEDPYFKDRTADQILDAARDQGLAGVQGQLLHETRLMIQGHPARDIQGVARGAAAYDNRLVLVGNRLYSLLVIDTSGRGDLQNTERFFNSLRWR